MLLDWKSATIELASGTNPSFAPLDAPYQPEKDVGALYGSYGSSPITKDEVPDDVNANGLRVAPQFASVARTSNDRDVLVWCARSASDAKNIALNFDALSRRFPRDVALLSWACDTQLNGLSLSTRTPGPLSSPYPAWSVQVRNGQSGYQNAPGYEPDFKAQTRAKWDALAVRARQGQKMESGNGFWWWLEAACLLGARRDELVWNVLRVGKTKTQYDHHNKELQLTLRRAHLKTIGVVPMSFYLRGGNNSWQFYSRWREVTRQVCENVIGARLQKRHKIALEGGRDMVMMGKMLRSSSDSIGVSVGIAVENIALRSALPPSVAPLNKLGQNPSAQILAGHPRSLLRYAGEQKRSDIALEITSEWNAVSKARGVQMGKAKAAATSSTSSVEGVSDALVATLAGLQNTGALLVQTLPVALALLALLSISTRAKNNTTEAIPVPSWTRGLGWSAFALLVLFAAQTMLSHLVWLFLGANYGMSMPISFDFALPRLAALLPSWAFGFPALTALVGAVWTCVIASRRARGDKPLLVRLRGMLGSSDERTGSLDLSPMLQLIALVGVWCATIALLGAWFFFPQQGALVANGIETFHSETLHDQAGGFALALFGFIAVVPALFLRAKPFRVRAFLRDWRKVARRFLVAHLALTTLLYLLISLGGAFCNTRFEREWERVNVPQSVSTGR